MNNIHYYPYASFTDNQLPLLKATALYFDKLYILDPFQASWDVIGAGGGSNEISLLKKKKILDPISPGEVLEEYQDEITAIIRMDMEDPEYLSLCEKYSKRSHWTMALAKVPKEIREDPRFKPIDQSMQHLMGDFSRDVAKKMGQYREDYMEYAEGIRPYDEYREGESGDIEYRYVEYPVALGESIMINHALFASLLHNEATPITDDSFHKRVLEYKIKKASELPLIQEVLDDRFRNPQLKKDFFAHYLLTDREIEIPTLSKNLPLEEIFEYREDHKDELSRARKKIAEVSRRIKDTPLTQDFEKEVDAAMADISLDLSELAKTRKSWLKSDRGKLALKASGLTLGLAATTLSIVLSATPIAPVALAVAGVGLLADKVIPGLEIFGDWKAGKATGTNNGLHYFINYK